MADKKITELTALTTPDPADVLPIVDVSATSTKKITVANLLARAAHLFNVLDYGAVGNGSTDDSGAFQDAIDAAEAAGGGIVYAPAAHYALVTGLVIDDDGTVLLGDGIRSTYLERSGSSTAPVVWVKTPDGQVTKIRDSGTLHLSITGNYLAQYGLRVTSVNNCEFGHLYIAWAGALAGTPDTDWQLYMDCWDTLPGGGEDRGNQHNNIHDIWTQSNGTEGGIKVDGNPTGTVVGNTSLNYFENIQCYTQSGDAFYFGNSDGNILNFLRVYRGSGTGRGLVFAGDSSSLSRTARDNQAINVQAANAGIHALAGTYPSSGNIVWQNTGNTGGTAPTIASGAKLGYINQGALDGLHLGGSSVVLDAPMTLTEMAAPGTPASGRLVVYVATDGTLHTINDAGSDVVYGSSANNPTAGEKTWLTNGLAGQVAFPATVNPSAGANTLDDYEEGAFTPVFSYGTAGTSSWANALQLGRYTKIGNRVFFQMTIQTVPTNGTGSGNLNLGGLPFICVNVTNAHAVQTAVMQGWTKASHELLGVRNVVNFAAAVIEVGGSAQAVVIMGAADIPTGGTVILKASGVYETTG